MYCANENKNLAMRILVIDKSLKYLRSYITASIDWEMEGAYKHLFGNLFCVSIHLVFKVRLKICQGRWDIKSIKYKGCNKCKVNLYQWQKLKKKKGITKGNFCGIQMFIKVKKKKKWGVLLISNNQWIEMTVLFDKSSVRLCINIILRKYVI